MPDQTSFSNRKIETARSDPFLRVFGDNFGKERGDAGVIAFQSDNTLGAAWVRLENPVDRPHPEELSGFGFATTDEPEMAVGVDPRQRGKGVGQKLVRAVLDEAKAVGHKSIVLNVRETNKPAIHVYEKVGFKTVGDVANRAGTRSLVMRYVFE